MRVSCGVVWCSGVVVVYVQSVRSLYVQSDVKNSMQFCPIM